MPLITSEYHSDLIVETSAFGNYLFDIVQKASMKNIYIDSIKTKINDDKNIYEITIKVKNKDELEGFIKDLYNFSYIRNVIIK